MNGMKAPSREITCGNCRQSFNYQDGFEYCSRCGHQYSYEDRTTAKQRIRQVGFLRKNFDRYWTIGFLIVIFWVLWAERAPWLAFFGVFFGAAIMFTPHLFSGYFLRKAKEKYPT